MDVQGIGIGEVCAVDRLYPGCPEPWFSPRTETTAYFQLLAAVAVTGLAVYLFLKYFFHKHLPAKAHHGVKKLTAKKKRS